MFCSGEKKKVSLDSLPCNLTEVSRNSQAKAIQNTHSFASAKGERRQMLFLIALSLDCISIEVIKRILGGEVRKTSGQRCRCRALCPAALLDLTFQYF